MEPIVRFEHTGAFAWSQHGYAWAAPLAADREVDATLVLALVSVAPPRRTIRAWFHGRLTRDAEGDWLSPLNFEHATGVVQRAYYDVWEDDSSVSDPLFDDARWQLDENMLPFTSAPRWKGAAADRVVAALGPRVANQPWMQDWPLEVSDPSLLPECCAAYDRAGDSALRFDLMALALYSFDQVRDAESIEAKTYLPWFEARMSRAFAELAHLILYWASWQHCGAPIESPDEYWLISPLMRHTWARSLVPIPIRAGDTRSPARPWTP